MVVKVRKSRGRRGTPRRNNEEQCGRSGKRRGVWAAGTPKRGESPLFLWINSMRNNREDRESATVDGRLESGDLVAQHTCLRRSPGGEAQLETRWLLRRGTMTRGRAPGEVEHFAEARAGRVGRRVDSAFEDPPGLPRTGSMGSGRSGESLQNMCSIVKRAVEPTKIKRGGEKVVLTGSENKRPTANGRANSGLRLATPLGRGTNGA